MRNMLSIPNGVANCAIEVIFVASHVSMRKYVEAIPIKVMALIHVMDIYVTNKINEPLRRV